MKYLYHVTDQQHAAKILQSHMLKPMRGTQTQMVNDAACVYLCQRKDIAIWQLILGKPIVLQIPITDIPQNYGKSQYDGYTEYLIKHPIHSKKIKDVSKTIYKQEIDHANIKLCCSYLWSISQLCTTYANKYTKQVAYPYLIPWTKATLSVLSHMDYSKVELNLLKAEINKMREACAFAFTDIYCNTKKRLWEQLIEYPTDDSTQIRQALYEFIEKNLKAVGYENTGGYTA